VNIGATKKDFDATVGIHPASTAERIRHSGVASSFIFSFGSSLQSVKVQYLRDRLRGVRGREGESGSGFRVRK